MKRLRLISALVVLVVGLLAVRLFFLQVIRHDYYADKADRQYQHPADQLPDRGAIFFQTKGGEAVSAAAMRDGFLLALNPKLIANPETTFQKLNQVWPLDYTAFLQKATKTDDPYEEIATHLNNQEAAAIKNLGLAGVNLYKTRWRFYPGDQTAAHVLGLVNYEGVGTYGLEKFYENTLHRNPDESFVNFLSGVISDVGGTIASDPSQSQGDLVLTIEPTVQNALENQLTALESKWHSALLGGIVMDPRTGAIIAMAARPTFSPGGRQTSLEYLNNPLVEKVFELGSIFKPLTMAAALDAGVVKATTTYNDQGFLVINNQRIENYDGKGRGVVPMQEVLNQSLNTGAVFAMEKLGRLRFRDYLLKYGLAEKTGIDLPGEVAGLTNNLNSPREVEYATAAFGQGVALTPIAMTRALAVLANGGQLIRPQVVAKFNYLNSRLSRTVKPEIVRTVLKPETSREITRMLVTVVDKALKGGIYKIDKYSIAAKTGTAQQVQPGGTYDPSRFLHSFFGYFPASQPRFLIFLFQQYPQGALYASDTLAEPFFSLTKFLLNYYNVPPDR